MKAVVLIIKTSQTRSQIGQWVQTHTCIVVFNKSPWEPAHRRLFLITRAPKWSKVLRENLRLSDPFAQQGLLLCGELEVSVSHWRTLIPFSSISRCICVLSHSKPSLAVLKAKWILVSPTLGHAFGM
ncbi:hypothetical protein Q8A73_005385 [Channa argus]|nr:hypothetical protein Q8A73_005385 [Channa argus]